MKARTRKFVEELCQDDECQKKPDTHWHPLSVDALAREADGEYSLAAKRGKQ